MKNRIAERKVRDRSVYYLLGIIAFAVILMTILDPNFLTVRNLMNILNQQSTLGIATIGVSIALITGCIDLTIGNMLASTAALAAIMLNSGMPPGRVVIITCLAGAVAGTLNGVIVIKTRINTFIGTLGLMTVYQGIAFIIPGGQNIYLQGKFSQFGAIRIVRRVKAFAEIGKQGFVLLAKSLCVGVGTASPE